MQWNIGRLGRSVRFVVVMGGIGWAVQASDAFATDGVLIYPKARQADVADDYHGVRVADPYRWLEEPDSEETKSWIEAENKVTFAYLDRIPARPQIKKRLTDLWNYERYGQPERRGSRYFFSKNDGLQNQPVLYVRQGLEGDSRVLLDANLLSADGTVSLSGTDLTEDGRLLAYGVSSGGSDWKEWRVRDVETGQDRDDLIRWVKFYDATWTKDGQGFFYSRFDEPSEERKLEDLNYYQKVFHHRLGTPQSEDRLVYERRDQKEWGFGPYVTDDGRYLILNVTHGTRRQNMVFYKDLANPDGPVVELIREFEAEYEFVDNDGTIFWFRTDLNAPRYRLVAIDVTKPDRSAWKELIPQTQDTLVSVSTVGDRFIGTYLKDARSAVRVFDLTGKPVRDVELPGPGTVAGFTGRRNHPEAFYSFTSFVSPTTVYRYDVAADRTTVFHQPKVDFNPEEYETKQVFYSSKDGTRVPMFLSHRKGIKLDGRNPTLLYGYGGFNISITPVFRVSTLVWMEMGGVYAVANLRGGGEYGKEWHQAGMKLKKQNVFDDFISAAEWLVENKYTSPSKLAINGYSNGGLLVGAAMTQRPDLFAAAVPGVGVMDMLRFHKYTIGWAWTSDYGCADNADEFKTLYAYSPLHNLKPGAAYPATLITTADHDDRVVPAHSFKFAAALQAAHSGPNPVLIRIQTRAGHGAGKPTSMQIDEAADVYSFLVRTLNVNVSQLPGATEVHQGAGTTKPAS